MTILTDASKWSVADDGAWVSFRCRSLQEAKNLAAEIIPGKQFSLVLSKYRQKRSTDANSLLWVLCSEISKKVSVDGLFIPKEEIYRKAIKDVGKSDYVAVPEKALDTFLESWKANGTGWFAEKVDNCKLPGCAKVCVYYGSSTYNTQEMSILLDYVIEDARSLDIPILTDEELSKIKEDWKN